MTQILSYISNIIHKMTPIKIPHTDKKCKLSTITRFLNINFWFHIWEILLQLLNFKEMIILVFSKATAI